MKIPPWFRAIGILALLIVIMLAVNTIGIERIRDQVEQMGWWAPLAIFSLRFISIILPAIPSTIHSLLAGTLLGFWQGLGVILLADFIACPLNFWLARRFGRDVVIKLVGSHFMLRVDELSRRHLENNTFLMAALLMTGLFDFVCYAVGLTQTQWRKFIPALVLGVVLSDPPVVAIGAGVFEGGRLLLGFALLGMFFLAAVTGWVRRSSVNSSHHTASHEDANT